MEPFWEDEENIYSFNHIISHYVAVYYADGSEKNIKEALADGDVTIADLDRFGVGYLAEKK